MTQRSIDLATSATVAQDAPSVSGNDQTVVQRSHDAATLVADPSQLPQPVSGTLNATLRTTVLPRVEIVGEGQRIVSDGKLRYELANRLGEGGVGEVLKARDNDIDRDVAIKRLRAEMQSSHATVLRFAEEVRTVGRLEHPNVVPIHDVGVDQNGEYFFVMKYVQGETLEAIIQKLAAGDTAYLAKYDFERRVEIMMGVLEAIAYAHSKGIIHRDIKPANVMVGPYGEVMVMDWGLAREVHGPERALPDAPSPETGSNKLFHTQLGTLLGTPAYMSPEQARGEELDERSDIYSLSMTFYELLTLEHPHGDAPTLEDMLHAVKSANVRHAVMVSSAVQATVPADLDWFVERGLRKNKAERYQSAEEMIARLRRRAAGDIPIQCPATFSIRATTVARKAISRHPLLVPALLFLGMLATIAVATSGAVRFLL